MCIYISYNHVFWKRYAFVLPLGRCDEMEALAPFSRRSLKMEDIGISFWLADFRRTQQAWRSVLWPVMILVWPPNSWTASLSSRLWTCLVHQLCSLWSTYVHVVGSRATQVQRGRALTLPRRRSFKNCLVLLMVCFGLFWTILACWYLRVSPFGAVFPWCLWCLRHASRHWRMPRQMQWNASSSTRHGSGGVLAGLGWCRCAQEKQAP